MLIYNSVWLKIRTKTPFFVIDEASMISNQGQTFFSQGLLQDLFRYVSSGKNCAMMFVGDTAQLPPVGLLESPALDPDYLNREFGLHVLGYEMSDVVRQKKHSGILFNATKIRNLIRLDNQSFEYSYPQFVTKGFADLFRMNGDRLIEGLHYAYDNFGLENCMVICRSNRSANLYNKHIRNQILFRDEEITGGDIVMVVKNNYYWLGEHDQTNTGFIANGDMAAIKKVSNLHEMHGFRFADLDLEFLETIIREMLFVAAFCSIVYTQTHRTFPTNNNRSFTRASLTIMGIYRSKKGSS